MMNNGPASREQLQELHATLARELLATLRRGHHNGPKGSPRCPSCGADLCGLKPSFYNAAAQFLKDNKVEAAEKGMSQARLEAELEALIDELPEAAEEDDD